jgi:hypothetical protein
MSASFGTTVHGGGMNGTGRDPRGSYGVIGGSTVIGTTAGAVIGTGMNGISPGLYADGMKIFNSAADMIKISEIRIATLATDRAVVDIEPSVCPRITLAPSGRKRH